MPAGTTIEMQMAIEPVLIVEHKKAGSGRILSSLGSKIAERFTSDREWQGIGASKDTTTNDEDTG
jgi:hypothetical protein